MQHQRLAPCVKNGQGTDTHPEPAQGNLGIFRSPSQQARIGFACRSPGNSHWTCELAAPSCADCGDWRLEQLQMQDKANNITTLRAAQNDLLASIRLDISSDLCDSTPPALQSVALDQNAVSNVEQSTILVTVRLHDACGVLSVSGQATGPQTGGVPPRLYVTLTAAAGDPGIWNGRLVVPRLAAKGSWRISFIQVVDRGQKMKSYAQDDPLLTGATFSVQKKGSRSLVPRARSRSVDSHQRAFEPTAPRCSCLPTPCTIR